MLILETEEIKHQCLQRWGPALLTKSSTMPPKHEKERIKKDYPGTKVSIS